MKVLKIDHIGIAVDALDKIAPVYRDLLNLGKGHEEEVPSEKVKTHFFEAGEVHIELLEATDPNSAIAKFVDKRGPGINHICYLVDDIQGAIDEAKAKGYQVLDEKPRNGAGGSKVAFLHPKSTGGVLIEFKQAGVGGVSMGH